MNKECLKGYYRIDKRYTKYGIYELYESLRYSDEVESLVTLNGIVHGYTYESLDIYIEELED